MRFAWDKANLEHLARHDLTAEETEQVIAGPLVFIAFQQSSDEFRRVAVGITDDGKCLTVVYLLRGGFIRVITAFPATNRRRRMFEERTGL
jgi:hypothetical protein